MMIQKVVSPHHNKEAALYNITDEGLSTRENTLRKILQWASNSTASRFTEANKNQSAHTANNNAWPLQRNAAFE